MSRESLALERLTETSKVKRKQDSPCDRVGEMPCGRRGRGVTSNIRSAFRVRAAILLIIDDVTMVSLVAESLNRAALSTARHAARAAAFTSSVAGADARAALASFVCAVPVWAAFTG